MRVEILKRYRRGAAVRAGTGIHETFPLVNAPNNYRANDKMRQQCSLPVWTVDRETRGEAKHQRSEHGPGQLVAYGCMQRPRPWNVRSNDEVYAENESDQSPSEERKKPTFEQRRERAKKFHRDVGRAIERDGTIGGRRL